MYTEKNVKYIFKTIFRDSLINRNISELSEKQRDLIEIFNIEF